MAALFAVWWLLTASGAVSPDYLPSLPELFRTYKQLISHGYANVSLGEHIWVSLRRCLLGFGIGGGLGMGFGLITGYYKSLSALVSPLVALFRPIPPLAYLPLLVTFFGIGEGPKVILIATAAFFYMLITTAAGVRGVPQDLIRAGQTLGLSRRQLFTSVIFRASLPSILTGVNVALVLSWGCVVAAELVAANSGLGFIAINASTYYEVNNVYAAVILIGLIGAFFEFSVRMSERLLVPWVGK